MVANAYSFKNLVGLHLVFKTIGEFQCFLLFYNDFKKCSGCLPESLEVISVKLDFSEYKIDELYTEHLISQLIQTPGLKDFGIEIS